MVVMTGFLEPHDSFTSFNATCVVKVSGESIDECDDSYETQQQLRWS
jgi:hypothetical protein